jgi:hypothetical protein
MPRLSRWFVRAAFISLLIGLGLGIARGWGHPGAVLDPTALHLLVVGWLTQMVFGVAFWLFPRHSAERPRGSEPLGWAVFGALQIGLILRLFAEPGLLPGRITPVVLAISGLLQLAAAIGFAANTWPRIREKP